MDSIGGLDQASLDSKALIHAMLEVELAYETSYMVNHTVGHSISHDILAVGDVPLNSHEMHADVTRKNIGESCGYCNNK